MPQPRGNFWEYVKAVLEQPPVKQPTFAPKEGSEVARTPIPDSEGKIWLDLVNQGRYSGGVKIALTPEVLQFVLGQRSEQNFQALKSSVAAMSKNFANVLRPDVRFDVRGDLILAFA